MILYNLNAREKIVKIQNTLEEEQSSSLPIRYRLPGMKQELIEAYHEEESYWSQNCKGKWLKLSDRKSKFFHVSVKSNKNSNVFHMLLDSKGVKHRAD